MSQSDKSKKDEPPKESWLDTYWVPEIYIHISEHDDKYRKYQLSILQRIFITLEFPQSRKFPRDCEHPICENEANCPGEKICLPVYNFTLYIIEYACVLYFLVETCIRWLLSGIVPTRLSGTMDDNWDEKENARAFIEGREPELEPNYSSIEQFFRYLFSVNSFLDALSFLPTIILLRNNQNEYAFLRFFVVLRLYRFLMIHPRGRLLIRLLKDTIYDSREAITIYMIFLGMFILFFSAIIFSVERGTYGPLSPGQFAYLRPDGNGGVEQSPFDSISTSLYYMIVTVSTIGYGDLFPKSSPGRAIASISAILSLLILALPVTIIGSNFTARFAEYEERLRIVHHKLNLKRAIAAKKIYENSVIQQIIGENFALTIDHYLSPKNSNEKPDENTNKPDDVVEDEQRDQLRELNFSKRGIESLYAGPYLRSSSGDQSNDTVQISNPRWQFHRLQNSSKNNIEISLTPSKMIMQSKSTSKVLGSNRLAVEIGDITQLSEHDNASAGGSRLSSHETLDEILGLPEEYLESLNKDRILHLFRYLRTYVLCKRNQSTKDQLKELLLKMK